MVEECRQAQARLPEIEQDFASRHPDYLESIRRLEPGRETPIPPTAYFHTVINLKNPAGRCLSLVEKSRNPDEAVEPGSEWTRRQNHRGAESHLKWSQLSGQRITGRGRVGSTPRASGVFFGSTRTNSSGRRFIAEFLERRLLRRHADE